MHSLKKTLPALVTVAFLAVAGAAIAQSAGAPRLDEKTPFLGRVSGGAAVNYKFDRAPGTQTVTIARHKARVQVVGETSEHEYTALVSTAGLRAGRTYRVTITALAPNGKTKLTYSKVLYLHRSLNRP